MFVLAQVTASPGSLLIVASHLLFFLLVFLFDVLNVADPRSFHDKARKIHHLSATLYKSKHKEKHKYLPSDPIYIPVKILEICFYYIGLKTLWVKSYRLWVIRR